ncbi:hypothetical protein Ddc_12239 [Ditylenchus destructor]|nr:hypothetical protein Ddc_12239 [Ditylenchus destructor]
MNFIERSLRLALFFNFVQYTSAAPLSSIDWLNHTECLSLECPFPGTDLGNHFYAYTFNDDDYMMLIEYNESELPNRTCIPGKDEGIRLFYVNYKKFFVPVEFLIKCDRFKNAQEKYDTIKQFVKHFEQHSSPNKISEIGMVKKEFMCRDQYGRLVSFF